MGSVSGIYCIYFEDQPYKYYIGLASNIHTRRNKHLSLLRKNEHFNYKLQEAYNVYGSPVFQILEECSISELVDKEKFYITEFDSVNTGYNILEGGRDLGYGEQHPRSYNTDEEYAEVLFFLVYTGMSAQEISKELNISLCVVQGISCCTDHIHLKNMYPEEYTILLSKKGTRVSGKSSAKDKGIVYPKIISPEGGIFEVFNTREFARIHQLDQAALHRVLTYKNNTCKGWRRYE